MNSSLKNLCGVPAMVKILNHPLLKNEIFCQPINLDNFRERDEVLQRAVSEFLKDYNLAIKVFTPKHLILFVGFEMWKWAENQNKYFDLSFEFSKNFITSSFFTSEGLIDEEKAARKLVMEPGFSDFLKYSVACHYFLEDIIPPLWQVLQKNKTNFIKLLKDHKSRTPIILWSNYLKKKNSASKPKQKVLTRRFKIRVFTYGIENQNVAAVKFSLGSKGRSRENKTEAKIIRKLVYKSFSEYVRPILETLHKSYWVLSDSLLSAKFVARRDIILYFISSMNKRELKEFFLKFDFSFKLLTLCLLWPYQNQFMDFAYIIYENFGIEEYNKLMGQIIWHFDDEFVCESYNYRLLLRDFWIKSPPHLKREIIINESENNYGDSLITMLLSLRNFVSDGLVNINLILENANSFERENILRNQMHCIFQNLIFPYYNCELADLFLKNLNLNPEILQTFKRDLTFDLFKDIMKKQNINAVEKIFKWAVESDDIDNFKEEIFNRLTSSNKTEHFFLDLKEKTPFSFLNKILKWFLKTDEKIEEWNNNIVYSPLIRYSNPKWFDNLLKFRGYSLEEASVIKKELLYGKLPEIARGFLSSAHLRVNIENNVYFLCLLQTEKLREFTRHLRSFYDDSIKQKMCLLCLNNNHVLGDGEETQLRCENHGVNGFISLKEVQKICSNLSKEFGFFPRLPELNLQGFGFN